MSCFQEFEEGSSRVQGSPSWVRGSEELQNEVLRAPNEEAWDDFLLEAFSCQVCSFFVVLGRLKLVPEGVELRPRRSLEVKGSPELQNGGLRALEEARDDFLLETFSCQVCSFFVLLGRLKLAPGGVALRPWRSLEVRGSPELQNGGLRALEEAWVDFLLEAFSCQVCSFLWFWGVSSWFQKVLSCVPGGLWRSGEGQSSRTLA